MSLNFCLKLYLSLSSNLFAFGGSEVNIVNILEYKIRNISYKSFTKIVRIKGTIVYIRKDCVYFKQKSLQV